MNVTTNEQKELSVGVGSNRSVGIEVGECRCCLPEQWECKKVNTVTGTISTGQVCSG